MWRELGAVVHRTRVAGKEARAAVRPEYVAALLPPFEAVVTGRVPPLFLNVRCPRAQSEIECERARPPASRSSALPMSMPTAPHDETDPKSRPLNPLVNPLLTDLYAITMAYAHWRNGRHRERAPQLFFRRNPFGGEYTVFAGLEECVKLLHAFRFTDEQIEFLKRAGAPAARRARRSGRGCARSTARR